MDKFKVLIDEMSEYIDRKKNENKRIFVTSSFQTQSVVLLHILSKIDKKLPIFFLNTGYHFPETIEYKKQLTKLFDLNVIDIFSFIAKSEQRNENGELLYFTDPDRCCYYNKIQPLENILSKYDIWINGVRKDQTSVRKSMEKEMKNEQGNIALSSIVRSVF